MTPKEISRIIEKEIDGNYSLTNAHGVDLRKCLIRPRKRSLIYETNKLREFWVVLEEFPETAEGFKIIFDEENGKFGLAQYAEPKDYVLCFRESFLKALESM